MKIEWLATNVTAAGSLDKAEYAIFWDDFDWAFLWPIQSVFVVEEPLCDVNTPS